MNVPPMTTTERTSPLYTVQLVRKDVIEMRGSSSKKRETSYPFMFLKSVIPIRIRKRRKKKTDQNLLMF